jgi:hypothetical protein
VDEKFGSGEGDVASAFFTVLFRNRMERWAERKMMQAKHEEGSRPVRLGACV